MASTRTNLTLVFTGALIAVTTALGLTLWTVRNASLYRDVARYAVTQADVAATLVRDATSAQQAVIVGADTPPEKQIVTPRLRTILDAFPDYLVVVDQLGTPLYLSTLTRELPGEVSDTLLARISALPNDSAAVVSVPGVEELLLVSRQISVRSCHTP